MRCGIGRGITRASREYRMKSVERGVKEALRGSEATFGRF